MKEVIRMHYGSHLYGTNTPDSDQDYKGVFIPSLDEMILGRIPREIKEVTKGKREDRKNTSEDVDIGMYSLQHFLKLACDGDTVALDMLHAPRDKWILNNYTIADGSGSPVIWNYLHSNRSSFYTKDMKSYMGYLKKQACKYGIKGSRVKSLENAIDFLDGVVIKDQTLRRWWELLPTDEHSIKIPVESSPDSKLRYYEVCNRKFSETMRVGQALPILRKLMAEYGQRAHMARDNEGVDWKAISHAMRAAYQLKHIYLDGDFTYPLPETNHILSVKLGERQWSDVEDWLEELVEEVKVLAANSNLLQKVDRRRWDRWLVETVRKYGLGMGPFSSLMSQV